MAAQENVKTAEPNSRPFMPKKTQDRPHIIRTPPLFDNAIDVSDPFWYSTNKGVTAEEYLIYAVSSSDVTPFVESGAAMNGVAMDFYNRLLERVEIPSLTIETKEFHDVRDALSKDIAVFRYKEKQPLLWVVFVGGTGTGKSTLFNAVCGASISTVGMERPTTNVPVVYIHTKNSLGEDFPFPGFPRSPEDAEASNHGAGKRLIVALHDRDEMDHLAVVDTPDLDSLDIENRRIAEDLYRLADLIIFVTSQEKYADEIPSRTLGRVEKERRPYFFLFNKTDPANTREEVIDFFRKRGLALDDKRVWFIPYMPAPSLQTLPGQEEFGRFAARFSETVRKETSRDFLIDQRNRRRAMLKRSVDFFLDLAEHENTAAGRWLQQLGALFEEQGRALFHQFETHFKRDNQGHIQQEIRRIYSRYDILSKPRHYVKQFVLAPLRLLGLRDRDADRVHRKDLAQIQKQADITPILSAMSAANRRVLETLSLETLGSPFSEALHREALVLSDKEIQERVGRLQERLIEWLEGKFRELAKGISKYKELGIYSTAIMWGGLILSFEVVLGGGITFIEAALDSFLAPLVTKGSVNLFAYHEIQGIARELDTGYRKGILDILEEQKQRYASCLEPFLIPEKTIKGLQDLKEELGTRE